MSSTQRELIAVLEQEFAKHGMPLKPGAAATILEGRTTAVAEGMRVTRRTAARHVTPDALRRLASKTAQHMNEQEAAEDALAPTVLSSAEAGVLLSAFSVAARLGVVNGDPSVAADLCEVITGISLQLRSSTQLEVSTRLLRNGLRWAQLPADRLSSGDWTVLPGQDTYEENLCVAAVLHRDLTWINSLLYGN